MPYGQAKKYVEKKVAPEIKEYGDVLINASYAQLLKKFDSHTKKASEYIDHAKYPGHDKDKQDYLGQIINATDKFLQKKGTYKEFLKYTAKIDIQSEKLHEKVKVRIKRKEQAEYLKVSQKNADIVRKGEFDKPISDLVALHMQLSPLNRTSRGGDLKKRNLRLDKMIEERINNLKNQKKIYNMVLQPDNILMFGKNKGVAIYQVEKGKVGFSEYDKLKTGKSMDMETSNSGNLNWQDFFQKYKIGKFKLGKLDYNKGTIKEIEIKEDKDVAKSLSSIGELKLLKEINYIYGGKLEKLIKNPKQKEALKIALDENYNKMRLFFQKDSKGIIKPTKVYKASSNIEKVKKLLQLKEGFKLIIERLQLEKSIETEKDPKMKMFKEAELAFRNKNNMQAYGKFRKFIRQNGTNSKYTKQVKVAKARLKACSIYVLNIGQNYLASCLNEPEGNQGFYLGKDFKKHMTKRLQVWMKNLQQAIATGKARDLNMALEQVNNPLEGHGNYPKNLGRTETHFITFHFNKFLKNLVKTASETDKEKQKELLLRQGDKARKDKYFQGAAVLYKEYTRSGLTKNQKKRNKDGENWELKRIRFLALIGKNPKIKKDGGLLNMKNHDKALAAEIGFFEKHGNELKAIKRAHEIIGNGKKDGKAKFQKLSKAKQQMLINQAKAEIALGIINGEEANDNFLDYVKDNKGVDKAAYNYNDMADPFDEYWNVSDKGWETVKIMAQEAPVDIAIMAVSGGIGNVAANSLRGASKIQRVRKMLQAYKAARVGLSGSAMAGDMLISELADRTMREYLMNQKQDWDIKSFLAHSIGMYGGMKYIAGSGQKLLMRAGMKARGASVVSLLGIEAPWAMGISVALGEGQGSYLEQYGHSVLNMLKGRISMGLMNRATGGVLMKQEQNFYQEMQQFKGNNKSLLSTISKMSKEELNRFKTKYPNLKSFLADIKFIPTINKNALGMSLGNLKLQSINQLSVEAVEAKYKKLGLKKGDKINLEVENHHSDVQYIFMHDDPRYVEKPGEICVRAKSKGQRNGTLIYVSKKDILKYNRTSSKTTNIDVQKPKLDIGYQRLGFKEGDLVYFKDKNGEIINEYILKDTDPDDPSRVLVLNRINGFPRSISKKNIIENNNKGAIWSKQENAKFNFLKGEEIKIKIDGEWRHWFIHDFSNDLGKVTLRRFDEDSAISKQIIVNRRDILRNNKNGPVRKMVLYKYLKYHPGYKKMKFGKGDEIFVNRDDSLEKGWYIHDTDNDRVIVNKIENGKLIYRTSFTKDQIITWNKKGPISYDKLILEANKDKMTPELKALIDKGGETIRDGSLNVRIFVADKPLSEGSFGQIFKVYYTNKDSLKIQEAVIKRSQENPLISEKGKQEAKIIFMREVELANHIAKINENDNDPNGQHLIRPLVVSKEKGIIYKSVRDATGKSRNLQDTYKHMPPKDWLKQFAGAVKGLIYLHKYKIVHNDLKPDNIMIGKNGGVLIDIGGFVMEHEFGNKIKVFNRDAILQARYIAPDGSDHFIPQNHIYNDCNLMVKSIQSKLPIDMTDKYAVGTILVDYINKSKLLINITPTTSNLLAFAKKLRSVSKHPFEYINNDPKNGRDPGYVSLSELPALISKL